MYRRISALVLLSVVVAVVTLPIPRPTERAARGQVRLDSMFLSGEALTSDGAPLPVGTHLEAIVGEAPAMLCGETEVYTAGHYAMEVFSDAAYRRCGAPGARVWILSIRQPSGRLGEAVPRFDLRAPGGGRTTFQPGVFLDVSVLEGQAPPRRPPPTPPPFDPNAPRRQTSRFLDPGEEVTLELPRAAGAAGPVLAVTVVNRTDVRAQATLYSDLSAAK